MKKNNGSLPKNIIFFRDGVSESQYNAVLDEEFRVMKAAFAKAYEKAQTTPNYTVIVVGKRHHTRFFLKTGQGLDNPAPGTVVDRGVTEAWTWDFYLQAHKALKGTAKPAHYVVLHDEIFGPLPSGQPTGLLPSRGQKASAGKYPPGQGPADKLQQFVHNFCYLYGRCTKAVSLCPPVYYAHLLAERNARFIKDQYSDANARKTLSPYPVKKPSNSDAASLRHWHKEKKKFEDEEMEKHLKTIEPRLQPHNRVKDIMFYV